MGRVRLGLLVCLLLVSVVSFAAAEEVEYLVNEDFSSVAVGELPEGWVVIDGEPTACGAMFKVGDKALRIDPLPGGATGTNDYLFIPFPSQEGQIAVEFWAFTPGTAGRSIAFSVSRQIDEADATETYSREAGPYLNFRAGTLSYFSGGWGDLQRLDVTQWNQFRLAIDIPEQQADVWVNDTHVGVVPFRSDVDSLGGLVFTIFQVGGVSEPAFIDGILVYEL